MLVDTLPQSPTATALCCRNALRTKITPLTRYTIAPPLETLRAARRVSGIGTVPTYSMCHPPVPCLTYYESIMAKFNVVMAGPEETIR